MKRIINLFFLLSILLAFSLWKSFCLFAVEAEALAFFNKQAQPLVDTGSLTPLLEAAKDKQAVLLGEASHGTSEYYLWRKKISRRLIEEEGFSFIVVEGDWPGCFKVNLYVKGSIDADPQQLLRQSFQRWPRWMWGNHEVVKLIKWLRQYNADLPFEERVGFYGMDVYSLRESIWEIKNYIQELGHKELSKLKDNYRCFARANYDGFTYARAAEAKDYDCSLEVNQAIEVISYHAKELSEKSPEGYFNLKMNAFLVKNAEKYYRSALSRGPEGWNSRVYHMEGVLYHLLDFYGEDSKGIVWAHNTHVGDARATSMLRQNQVNLGQLSREALGKDSVFIVGFGTYQGEVIAGGQWGAPFEKMQVPAAKKGSIEELLAQVSEESFFILFDQKSRQKDFLDRVYGHRAIGVVYNPQVEHLGNYVPTRLPNRYDAFLFFRDTKALSPLGRE